MSEMAVSEMAMSEMAVSEMVMSEMAVSEDVVAPPMRESSLDVRNVMLFISRSFFSSFDCDIFAFHLPKSPFFSGSDGLSFSISDESWLGNDTADG